MSSSQSLADARPGLHAPASSRRKSSRSREAWITDPHALLAALAAAEASEREVAAPPPSPARPSPMLVEPEPAVRLAPPPLRTDERLARAASPEVVVIIRRRHAA